MTKTICDICGKEIQPIILVDPNEEIIPNLITISRRGKALDICLDCMLDIHNYIKNIRKTESGGDNIGN